MSYQDLVRSGGRPSGSSSAVTTPLLQQGNRSVEGLLLKLANNVTTLKRHIDLLGSAKDTVDHRHRISETNKTIQGLAQEIKATLTNTHAASSTAAPDQAAKHKKLLQDFATILQDYKATQKVAQEREAAYLPKPNPTAAAGTGRGQGGVIADQDGQRIEVVIEQQALLQAQQAREAAALETAVAHNEALIAERDAGIREIVRQIGEVNEMFQDLAVLVNDQGEQVRLFDEQITGAAERTREGARELVKAERTQRSTQNRWLWLWLIAAVFVSLIIIIVLS